MFKGEKGDNIVKQAWNWSTVHSSWNIVKTNCQLLLDCGFLSYCTQHLSHILILSPAFSDPPNRVFYMSFKSMRFFFFFTKTQNRYIAWCWISALTQNKHTFYILLYISTDETGWVPGENSSLARKVYQRERNDSFFVLPAVITSACSWGKHLTSSVQCSWMLKNSAWFISFRNLHLRKYDFLRVFIWLKKRLLITLSAMYDPL